MALMPPPAVSGDENPVMYYAPYRRRKRNPRLAPRCDNCNRWIEGAYMPDGSLPPPPPDDERIFCSKDCGWSYILRRDDERQRQHLYDNNRPPMPGGDDDLHKRRINHAQPQKNDSHALCDVFQYERFSPVGPATKITLKQ